MKRIVILGCENSHANRFLQEIKENAAYGDYEVLGVYSGEREAAEKLSAEFGVPVMDAYDEAVGKVDGIIITARHGKNHYLYAKPYIKSGIPMFIDKPITVDTDEAIEFMRELREAGVRVTGGSSLGKADEIIDLKKKLEENFEGATLGGAIRAPLQSSSEHGGFYFYAQHLVEMVCSVFGKYPKSVQAFGLERQKTVVFRYEGYDVVGVFTEDSYKYYAVRFSEEGSQGGEVVSSADWFKREFKDFDDLMNGEPQAISYDDFISPVFIMRAIEESLNLGKEVEIKKFKG